MASQLVHTETSDSPSPESDFEQSSDFPPPAMPPLPSQPFPVSEPGSRYRIGDASDDSGSEEEEEGEGMHFDTIAGPARDGHASSEEEVDNARALQSRARAGRAARVGRGSNADVIHISSESESDEDDEASMVIHSDVHGRKMSLSHSALEQFASPQPPSGASSSPVQQRKGPVQDTEPKSSPPLPAVFTSAAAAGPAQPPPLNRTPSSSGGGAHARAPSKEESATIDFYLRQAIQAKDLHALGDLVARANEKGVETDLVSQARSLLLEARAEVSLHAHIASKHCLFPRIPSFLFPLRCIPPMRAKML